MDIRKDEHVYEKAVYESFKENPVTREMKNERVKVNPVYQADETDYIKKSIPKSTVYPGLLTFVLIILFLVSTCALILSIITVGDVKDLKESSTRTSTPNFVLSDNSSAKWLEEFKEWKKVKEQLEIRLQSLEQENIKLKDGIDKLEKKYERQTDNEMYLREDMRTIKSQIQTTVNGTVFDREIKKIKENFDCKVYNMTHSSSFDRSFTYTPSMYPCKNRDVPYCPISKEDLQKITIMSAYCTSKNAQSSLLTETSNGIFKCYCFGKHPDAKLKKLNERECTMWIRYCKKSE
ncbi:DgyrCDS12329 [Dimorphilus gyrociliatus]|nr:DgyrCDS12329 [Dimorphilus gyrociliatus]